MPREPGPGITHVSSPHVLWNSRVNQFYLYFHGENTVTRVATSTDGILEDLAR